MVVPDYAQQLSSQRLAVSMLPGIEQSPSWNWIQSPQVLLASNQGFLNSYPHIQLLPSVSHDENLPTFRYKQNTLAALMLSTILACFSAFDAKNQCRSEAGYDVHEQFLDNYDDNDNSANGMDDAVSFQDERFACLQMFRVVIIPVGVMVLSLCIICLWVLWRHQRSLETMLLVTTNTKMDFCEHNYRTCRCLALPIAVITLSWIYGTVAIMLRPRLYQGSGDTNNGNSNEEENNPYLSLAAVDRMGHIGDNANLYYLCWISVCLCVFLSYQTVVDTVRHYRRRNREQARGSVMTNTPDGVETIFSLNRLGLASYRESRATWYQSLYRMRIRTGIWTAALLASLVVMASSVHIWREVLLPAAKELDVGSFRHVCNQLANSYNPELPPELCARTTISFFSGLVAVSMSLIAIAIHLLTRNGVARAEDIAANSGCEPAMALHVSQDDAFHGTHIPLRFEFILAVLLVILLGLNAVYATGVQGPAASVGNLYYASWISFLLCLRIALGCLEELCDIQGELGHDAAESLDGIVRTRAESRATDDTPSTPRYLSPSADGSEDNRSLANRSKGSFGQHQSPETDQPTDLMENERAQRTQKYLFLAVCAVVCSASAFDAAYNQANPLTVEQHYVIFTPAVVATVSGCQFLLCLHRRSYLVISQMWCGGLASVFVFGLCLGALVISMHSDNSWAVNAIGDVEIANLYYFTWASILTAGLQMMSYLKNYLGLKQDDYITVVWIAIVKISFVIFGAGYHIWHNISDTCTLTDIQSGAVTFCSRTIFAIAVSCTGMFVAGLVTLCRVVLSVSCPLFFSRRARAHVEMVASVFLMLLFGFAVATITGIGGPGQSVGDMFYSTWLNFLVSIGLVLICFQEIRVEDHQHDLRVREEMDTDNEALQNDEKYGMRESPE